MADGRLLLIRHSLTSLDLTRPAQCWPLSPAGIERAELFAPTVAEYRPVHFYHSHEQKAAQTAAIIARRVGCGCSQIEGLQEHDRRDITGMSRAEFRSHVRNLLQEPATYRFGGESGSAVISRFAQAIGRVLVAREGQNVAVVSHGTAITLFLASLGLVEPVAYWRALALPALIVLKPPPWQLVATINPDWPAVL